MMRWQAARGKRVGDTDGEHLEVIGTQRIDKVVRSFESTGHPFDGDLPR